VAASKELLWRACLGARLSHYFFGWGFLFGYIQTRTIISFIFASMERSVQQMLGATVRAAVAVEVRESVMPQIESTASESAIVQLLYAGEAGAVAAAQRARAFLGEPGNDANARVWLYLACAYGQQHAAASDQATKQPLADEAYKAAKRALAINPSLRDVVRGLMYEEDPGHLPGDNDLATLRDDLRFRELVGGPPA
jgi:hypothetical protein